MSYEEEIIETNRVSENMQLYGGSFVKKLGEALIHADPVNRNKIKEAFKEYWDEYNHFGEEKRYETASSD